MNRIHLPALLLVVAICCPFIVACGGGTTGPGQTGLSIAGSYAIVQRSVSDTCGDTGTPANVTGTVTHTQGATTFILRDTGGTTFNGTVQSDGSFTANAVFGPDAGGQTYTQQLSGTFTSSGFTARLTVQVTPRNCSFTRDWTGTKS